MTPASLLRRPWVPGILSLAVGLGLWWALAAALDHHAVPEPAPTLSALLGLLSQDVFWSSLASTMVGWAGGLALAVVVGVPVGFAVGRLPLLDRLTRVTFDVIRSIPLVVLTPVFVLAWGTSLKTKIVLVFLAAVWMILIQAAAGARDIDRTALDTARSYQLSFWQKARFLMLPSATPYIATGVRISATTALLVAVGVELITSAPGIGLQILMGNVNSSPTNAFAYFMVAAVLGFVIAWVFRRLELRTRRLHGRGTA